MILCALPENQRSAQPRQAVLASAPENSDDMKNREISLKKKKQLSKALHFLTISVCLEAGPYVAKAFLELPILLPLNP